MRAVIDPLLVAVLLTNFYVLGTSRLRAAVNGTALQGGLLGILALAVHGEFSLTTVLIAGGAFIVKAGVIPTMLLRAMRDAAIRREVDPVIGFIPSLLLGAAGTGLAILFAHSLPLASFQRGSLIIPASVSTVLTGFILLTTRRQAVMQVGGYLVLENGIFIMGLSLLNAVPFLVELGVLLDLFVGVFLMGIIIEHISRSFSSLDTTLLDSLKE
jgi:hydrogenase-4 component E